MANNANIFKQLEKIYYNINDSGSFGGVQRLVRQQKKRGLKVSESSVEKFLRDQASYSLHKPARKNFKRNPTVAGGIDKQWQADLADMQGISKQNEGVNYLLTVIDIFSKFAWAIPVKNKGGKEMLNAFKTLFEKSAPRIPEKLQTDAGTEFLNKEVQAFLKSKGVHHFVTTSDKKAAVVERFNRTLKTRMWAYFTAEQTKEYIKNLDEFVNSYNNSYHRAIGMKPSEVKKSDQDKIWLRLYGSNGPSKPKRKVKADDKVRISKVKGVFEKGYMPNWSEEHFYVKKEEPRKRPVYKLEDEDGMDIKGQFYKEEVQPISENRYVVEKILRKRKSKGKEEFFVKWKGWPAKFNSWITEDDWVDD